MTGRRGTRKKSGGRCVRKKKRESSGFKVCKGRKQKRGE